MATISLDLALLGDLRAVATGCPEDALFVAAPANPPTRHTERLSPQQMWVCGPSRARQVIRHKALLPPEFGFTACILGCGGLGAGALLVR
jgi:hypothetical protein